MTRIVGIVAVSVACLLALPSPASAGFWDWLEEYSGPGPFHGYSTFFTGCWDPDEGIQASPIAARRNGAIPVMRCIYTDKSWFTAEADPTQGYPEVTLTITDFGAAMRIANGLDIGAGLGWVAYYGDDMPKNRMIITPIRIMARPFVLLKGDARQKWYGIFALYWKQTFVPGPYTGDDFHQLPPPGVAKFATTNGEMLGSFGMTIDVTALIPNWPRRN